MKLSCPNDITHVTFSVGAIVSETWVVDQFVEYVARLDSVDVYKRPGRSDDYECTQCGAVALKHETKEEA